MENYKIIELKYPVETKDGNGNKVLLNAIQLSRVKGKHLRLLPKSLMSTLQTNDEKEEQKEERIKSIQQNFDFAEMFPFIASLANVSEDIIDEIDFEDLQLILEEVTVLVGESEIPQDGKK